MVERVPLIVMNDRRSTGSSSRMRGPGATPLGAMDSLVALSSLSGCPPEVGRVLEEIGWNVQRLGTLDDADEESIEAVATSVEEKMRKPLDVAVLLALIEVAAKAAKVSWQAEGRSGDAELLVAHMVKEMEDKMNLHRRAAAEKLRQMVPRKGKAKVQRWPTRLHRRLNEAGDNQALRESVERNERNRWIKELKSILREAGAPVMARDEIFEGVDLTRRYGKGRRASTLRKHVKTWERVRKWMKVTFHKAWPTQPEEFAMYLEARANEPCGRTVPSSIYKTLLFMEAAGEFPVEEQLGRASAVKNVLEEVNMSLAEFEPRFAKKAWHLPVKVVELWEEMVLDYRLEAYPRAYAWFRLIKLWSGMRFSDTAGLDHSSLEWGPFGITAVLNKTKTSGPGKKVPLLRIWVNSECYVRDQTWISTGFELWMKMSQESGLMERDFMLPCPSRNLNSFSKKVAKYADAARCSQALFNDMRVAYEDAVVPLFAEGVSTVWSEHSERVTMRTWSEAAGIPESVRKQMGRWCPTTDQGYERTFRTNTIKAQAKTAEFVRRSMGGRQDPFDEALILSAVTERMERLGFPQGAIDIQLEKLTSFGQGAAKRRRWEEASDNEENEEYDSGWMKVGDPPRIELLEGGLSVDTDEEEEVIHELSMTDKKGSGEGALILKGTYVVSIVGRSAMKTLHRVGECHRIPGLHYGSYEVLGQEPPSADKFHKSCQICFPRGMTGEEESGSDTSDGEENSSSDSSTSEEGPV